MELSEQKLRTLFTEVHRLWENGIIGESLVALVNRIAGLAPPLPRGGARAFVYYSMLFYLSNEADRLTVEDCETCRFRADAIQEFVARNMESKEMARALGRVRSTRVVLH